MDFSIFHLTLSGKHFLLSRKTAITMKHERESNSGAKVVRIVGPQGEVKRVKFLNSHPLIWSFCPGMDLDYSLVSTHINPSGAVKCAASSALMGLASVPPKYSSTPPRLHSASKCWNALNCSGWRAMVRWWRASTFGLICPQKMLLGLAWLVTARPNS